MSRKREANSLDSPIILFYNEAGEFETPSALLSLYLISLSTIGVMRMYRNIKLLTVILFIIGLSACTGPFGDKNTDSSVTRTSDYISKTGFLLNTVITINLYDKQEEELLNGCFDLIQRYEDIYSRTAETSELYKLNHRTLPEAEGSYMISGELSDILADALHYCELSGGAFDITIEPLSSLWDFTAEAPAVPAASLINAALPYVGYHNIQLKDNKIAFAKDKTGIDLGAIAKGYIADRVKDYLLARGVKSALINLGGNVLCIGTKPGGTPFHVGIQKPFADRNETVAVMDIDDLSVVSSGIYERGFEADGKYYHHILDPNTGYPYDNNLISVTILSQSSSDGDGLSTTCFALGLDKGLELINSLPDTYAVFITADYQIRYSDGFEAAIRLTLQ